MEYKWITDNEYHYCSGYYTTNKWIGNDKVVIMRSKDAVKGMNSESEGYASELVLVSLDDGTKKVLANDIYMFEDFVVYEDKVYYSNIYELKEIDVNTGKIRVVYRNEYYVGEKSLKIADGNFGRRILMVKYPKIQYLETKQSFIAKYFHIQKGEIYLLASTKNRVHNIPYFPEKEAEVIRNRLLK